MIESKKIRKKLVKKLVINLVKKISEKIGEKLGNKKNLSVGELTRVHNSNIVIEAVKTNAIFLRKNFCNSKNTKQLKAN